MFLSASLDDGGQVAPVSPDVVGEEAEGSHARSGEVGAKPFERSVIDHLVDVGDQHMVILAAEIRQDAERAVPLKESRAQWVFRSSGTATEMWVIFDPNTSRVASWSLKHKGLGAPAKV